MDETEEIRLAFIDITLFQDGSSRGGILTTDMETRPYEFRVTSPVKPTQIQKILYGNSLNDYVYGELICIPLISGTKEKVNVILARESFIVSIRPQVSIPLIFIQKNSQGPDGKNSYNFLSHKNFKNELTHAQSLLTEVAQNHDLFEPFERLKLALHEIHKAGIGEKVKSA